MTDLPTAEREAMENGERNARVAEHGLRYTGYRREYAEVDFEAGWNTARDFYGPERVAELERERDRALDDFNTLNEEYKNAAHLFVGARKAASTYCVRAEAAEQRERVLREALPDTVALHNALMWARKSLKTHVEWLRFMRSGRATEEELRILGGEGKQKECVEKYDAVCSVLRHVLDAHAALAASPGQSEGEK